MSLVEQLRDRGMGIIYVTHRLTEVVRLASRVMVFRDGQLVGTLTGDGIDQHKMVSMMVGREFQQFYQKAEHAIDTGTPALEVSRLSHAASACPVSFRIQPGEIVGFAGLVGAGRSELARALFGIEPCMGGEIRVHGQPVQIRSPIDAIQAGLALVPEDRKACGLLLQMPVHSNVGLTVLPRLGRFGWYNRAAEIHLARRFQGELGIRTPSVRQRTALLSGGNQQKVVLAKWLALEPKVLILDEPTRGIDVGAKSEIYRLIFQLAARGMAVMMISSEMEEIIGVADRVIVMHEGRIAGEIPREAVSESSVLKLAVGAGVGVGTT